MIQKVKTSRKSLAQLPPKTCAICLDDICALQQVSLDCCSHEYHYDCIKQWTGDCASSCPLCKKEIKTLEFKNVGG